MSRSAELHKLTFFAKQEMSNDKSYKANYKLWDLLTENSFDTENSGLDAVVGLH